MFWVSVIAGSAGGCARSKPPEFRLPRSDSTVLCLANSFDPHGAANPSITTDARSVCGAFSALGAAMTMASAYPSPASEGSAGSPAWPDLRTSWARGDTASGPLVLAYEGHGIPECDGGGPCIYSLLDGRALPWRGLVQLLPPATAVHWNAILLNTCFSNQADVRGIAGPFMVMTTAYGWGHAGSFRQPGFSAPLPSFAPLLVSALGRAGTDRNCDGMLTDRELELSVNVELSKQPSSPVSNAIVVVRRQADAELPLAWTRDESDACRNRPRLRELLESEFLAELPCRLRQDLKAQEALLERRSGLVESSLRYLAVVDARSCAGGGGAGTDVLRELGPLGSRARALGFETFVLGRAQAAPRLAWLRELVRFVTFSELDFLEIRDDSAVLSSLRDGRPLGSLGLRTCDATDEGTSPGRRGLAEFGARALRCLPRRAELVDRATGTDQLGCDLRETADPQSRSVSVRFGGRFPQRLPRLVRWNDFVLQGGAAPGEPLAFDGASAAPCFAPEGQCFDLELDVPASSSLTDWLLVETPELEEGLQTCAP